jgi:hypothetical protein
LEVDVLVENVSTSQRVGAALFKNTAPNANTWQFLNGATSAIGASTSAEDLSTTKALVYSLQAAAISTATFTLNGYTFERIR